MKVSSVRRVIALSTMVAGLAAVSAAPAMAATHSPRARHANGHQRVRAHAASPGFRNAPKTAELIIKIPGFRN